ncbi:hypothetical protein GOP47_0009972 [Adiantum capillus-veneris]|uniref:Pentatricopeptide repeat-containing protein n=1 Tax=Adiantum capillus-veneris TaxID=13818 RepID=A0A9D4ZK00_ADICA|nr:hypothetical protein GOP47_0009972 [Adiantum capillus-veneris]
MYAKHGCIEDAQRVMDGLPYRNVVSWSGLLAGYVQHANNLPASEFFTKMHREGIQPDNVMYLSIIKACATMGLLEQGKIAHEQILRSEIKADSTLGSALIDMYSQCGSLEDAHKVYKDLLQANVVSKSAMIAGYVEQGQDLEAIKLFVEVLEGKGILDRVNFLYVLRACGNIKSLPYAQLLYDQIVEAKLDSDLMVINTLINSYCKCESLQDAQKVFDACKKRDVVSFGIMMAGYFQQGQSCLSLKLFWRMIYEGLKPDEATFICGLKASGSVGGVEEVDHIYCKIVRDGFELNPAIGTALIDIFAKLKCLKESYSVFKSLSDRNIVLWSAIMTSYIEQGYGREALDIFDKMQNDIIAQQEKSSLLCVLKACIMTKDLVRGKIAHSHVIKHGFDADEALGSTLINMYFSCGVPQEGQNVFDSLSHQNVVTWSALISGYSDSGCSTLAFELVDDMIQKEVRPDRAIFLHILKACTSSSAIAQGKLAHHHILKHGLCSDVVLGNALIDMYGKCQTCMEAENVFDRLQTPDLISWSSIIAAHAESGNLHNTLECFENMQKEGMEPNVVTFLCTIKACCNNGALEESRYIHHVVVEAGLNNEDVIASALIDMYSKSDVVEDSYGVFAGLLHQDDVSWATIITSFVQHGHEFSALELFDKMQTKGLKPNKVTFLCILKACSNVGALRQGQLIHDKIVKSEFHSDVYLGNSVVYMYARFGSIDDAHNVFSRLSEQDRVSWEAMISGFSLQGNSDSVREYFVEMQISGFRPQETTYASILAACSHGGYIHEGPAYFNHSGEGSKNFPKAEHYNCMVDLFGRAGHLKAANEMLQSMPGDPDLIGWLTLLSACKSHGNVGLGKHCFEQAAQQAPDFAAGYALMSDLYADAGMWEDVHGLVEQRKSIGAWKKPGQAVIEVNNNLHSFTVGDFERPDGINLHACLDKFNRVMKREGYIPQVWAYSEALPIAFPKSDGAEKAAISSVHYPTKRDGSHFQSSFLECNKNTYSIRTRFES